jgi:hypothetical protein
MTAVSNAREFAFPKTWSIPAKLGFSVIPVPRNRKRPTLSWKVYQTRRATPEAMRGWSSRPTNIES